MTNAGETVQKRQTRWTGVVVSVGGDKTIRVTVTNLVKHERYGKYIRRQTKVAAHDPQNAAKLGDVVEIVPCRRISKTKSWRLDKIVRSTGAPVDVSVVAAAPEIPTKAAPAPAAEPAPEQQG